MLTTVSVHQVARVELCPIGSNGTTNWRDIKIHDGDGDVLVVSLFAKDAEALEPVATEGAAL